MWEVFSRWPRPIPPLKALWPVPATFHRRAIRLKKPLRGPPEGAPQSPLASAAHRLQHEADFPSARSSRISRRNSSRNSRRNFHKEELLLLDYTIIHHLARLHKRRMNRRRVQLPRPESWPNAKKNIPQSGSRPRRPPRQGRPGSKPRVSRPPANFPRRPGKRGWSPQCRRLSWPFRRLREYRFCKT